MEKKKNFTRNGRGKKWKGAFYQSHSKSIFPPLGALLTLGCLNFTTKITPTIAMAANIPMKMYSVGTELLLPLLLEGTIYTA
jgi:hypothetical protein